MDTIDQGWGRGVGVGVLGAAFLYRFVADRHPYLGVLLLPLLLPYSTPALVFFFLLLFPFTFPIVGCEICILRYAFFPPPLLLFLPLLIFPFVFPPSLVLEVVEKKAFGNTFDRVKRNADNLFRDGKVVGGEGGGGGQEETNQASQQASKQIGWGDGGYMWGGD